MDVAPSCPVLVIHEDDSFRKSLIATLDRRHFSVTFCPDGAEAIEMLERRPGSFNVIVLHLDLGNGTGTAALGYLGEHRDAIRCGLILVGESDPRLRTFAPWADETLMKPVDADYVATRAQNYCGCSASASRGQTSS